MPNILLIINKVRHSWMSCSTTRSAAEVERAMTLIKKLLDIQNTQNKAEDSIENNFILRFQIIRSFIFINTVFKS